MKKRVEHPIKRNRRTRGCGIAKRANTPCKWGEAVPVGNYTMVKCLLCGKTTYRWRGA